MTKKMNKLSAIIALSLAGTVALADSSTMDLLSDTRAEPIRDSWGDCIRTLDGLDPSACNDAPVIQKVMVLSADAFFDFNKDTIKPAGRASLDQLVADLRKAPEVRGIRLVGHTDGVGSEAYNQKLSERRANAVREYLINKSVNPNIISAYGEGKRSPIASNATAEGRAQNRRVDVTIDLVEKRNGSK